jgi:hydroxylamine reductase
MFTKAFTVVSKHSAGKLLARRAGALTFKRFQTATPKVTSPMFCFQCEQTSHNTGCTSVGICGKSFETASFQDMSLWTNGELAHAVQTVGGDEKLPGDLREAVREHVLDATMSTLTNVNFDEERIVNHIRRGKILHDEIRKISPTPISEIAHEIDADEVKSLEVARKVGIYNRKPEFQSDDCFGLRECALNGLTGTVAYFKHAETNRAHDFAKHPYTDEERDAVFKNVFEIYAGLRDFTQPLDHYLGLAMKVGETNVSVMSMLDRSHTTMFGVPGPTEVSAVPEEGKCLLLSGHDVRDVAQVCTAIEKAGLPINVYTHGELLPAHSYPELAKMKCLKGHFGNAWQRQVVDFKKFPGSLVMTTNCLMPPRRSYRERLFTSGSVGYEGIEHIDLYSDEGMKAVLDKAMSQEGFTKDTIEPWIGSKPHLCGFGHEALLSHAETIVGAIKAGALTDIFVIGGCDGTEHSRSYYKELAEMTPESSVILTLGCGKFRLRECELGTLGDSGIPRILDVGQCNDAFTGVVVALKLAEALKTDIHSLPLHFAISWFEQKATAILLSLLHMGIKNIKIGPAMPAFLTPNLAAFLKENFNLQQVKLDAPEADMKEFLGK